MLKELTRAALVSMLPLCTSCQPTPPAEAPPASVALAPSLGTALNQHPAAKLQPIVCSDPTLVHATVVTGPHGPILENATVELADGVIRRVVPGSAEQLEAAAPDCVVSVEGRFVLAGFWNTHVHFTDPVFNDLSSAEARIQEMLLRYGFTSVVDTGADPRVLHSLRKAIAGRGIRGPGIVIAGGSFVYKDGTPSYLPKGLLPEIALPGEAPPAVEAVLDAGADGIKIFSGSFQTPTHTIYLPPDVIGAITDAAHRRDAFVVAHPTDREGLVNAVDNGVDILAHTAPPAGTLDPELLERMREAKVALTPTLKLWRWELKRHGVPEQGIQSYVQRGVTQLRDYHAAGGEVLFGTDVGYMQDFDTTEEFALMASAGLDFHDLLATLTTHPARRFTETQGTIAEGEPADLVILQRDPTEDVTALAEIEATLRAGEVVYQRQ
jgi:imidazolonepropionase-like amidohydrolase